MEFCLKKRGGEETGYVPSCGYFFFGFFFPSFPFAWLFSRMWGYGLFSLFTE